MRQRRAEARHVGYAGELRTVHAPRRLFHNQVQDGVRRLGDIARPVLHKSRKCLDQPAAEYKAFPRQAVFEVLRHGRRRRQQPYGVISLAQRLAEPFENERGFAGAGK